MKDFFSLFMSYFFIQELNFGFVLKLAEAGGFEPPVR